MKRELKDKILGGKLSRRFVSLSVPMKRELKGSNSSLSAACCHRFTERPDEEGTERYALLATEAPFRRFTERPDEEGTERSADMVGVCDGLAVSLSVPMKRELKAPLRQQSSSRRCCVSLSVPMKRELKACSFRRMNSASLCFTERPDEEGTESGRNMCRL